jgi:hypothetical protein
MQATSENWTIAEAIAQTTPIELLQEFESARNAASKVANPRLRGHLQSVYGGTVLKLNPKYAEYKAAQDRFRAIKYAVEHALRVKLKAGELMATGRYEKLGNDPRPIPAAFWDYFKPHGWEKSTAIQRLDGTKIYIFEVRISRSVPTETVVQASVPIKVVSDKPKSVQHVEIKVSDVRACQSWLVHHMRAHPERRIATRKKWLARARERWRLSEMQFNRAWYAAIIEAPAPPWSAAGPPMKGDVREVPGW